MLLRSGSPKLPLAVKGEYVHPNIAARIYKRLTMEAFDEERGAFIPTSWTEIELAHQVRAHPAQVAVALVQIPGIVKRLHRSGEWLYKLEQPERPWMGPNRALVFNKGSNFSFKPSRA